MPHVLPLVASSSIGSTVTIDHVVFDHCGIGTPGLDTAGAAFVFDNRVDAALLNEPAGTDTTFVFTLTNTLVWANVNFCHPGMIRNPWPFRALVEDVQIKDNVGISDGFAGLPAWYPFEELGSGFLRGPCRSARPSR